MIEAGFDPKKSNSPALRTSVLKGGSRRAKLDNTTSSINVGIQNTQNSLYEFKRELKETVEEQLNSVQEKQSMIIQKQDTQQYLLISLCVLVGVAVALGLAKLLA